MKNVPRVGKSIFSTLIHMLIVLLVVLPLCSQILAFFCLLLFDSSSWFSRDLTFHSNLMVSREGLLTLTLWFCLAVFCFGMLMMGNLYGKYAALPTNQRLRYIPFLILIVYTVGIGAVIFFATGDKIWGHQQRDFVFVALMPFFWIEAFLRQPYWLPLMAFLTYSLFTVGVFSGSRRQQEPR
ncbi:hypothetical protein [Pragia fontium]|uniref:hypothetical protein n=1 Tax=Pragia fontium TaxID=82985 RepID=UPI0011874CBB|nr:hypothetical protein [Pragia fontium]